MKGVENYNAEAIRGSIIPKISGRVLVFGDLHLSAIYSGKHKNYMLDCYKTMDIIVNKVREEKADAVIFLGDLIGVNERKISDHQFLMRVVMFFGMLYNLTKGNVYSVRGNHDMGDFTDFDLLVGLGYIQNPKSIDYYADPGKENLELRFHLVNYGEDKRKLDLIEEGNVAFVHDDYAIEGVTNWYKSKNEVEIRKLTNFNGVDLIVAGHIHIPSSEMLYTNLPNGESVGLFYLGSPSRTAERFDDCWYFYFEYDSTNEMTDYGAKLMGIPNADEVFFDDSEFTDSDGKLYDEDGNEVSLEVSQALNDIVQEVINSRLATGDIFAQVDRLPASQESKDLAKRYLRLAIDGEI